MVLRIVHVCVCIEFEISGPKTKECACIFSFWDGILHWQILGGGKIQKKACEIFLLLKRPQIGLKFFGHISDRSSDLFSGVFQTVFRVKLTNFSGAISF